MKWCQIFTCETLLPAMCQIRLLNIGYLIIESSKQKGKQSLIEYSPICQSTLPLQMSLSIHFALFRVLDDKMTATQWQWDRSWVHTGGCISPSSSTTWINADSLGQSLVLYISGHRKWWAKCLVALEPIGSPVSQLQRQDETCSHGVLPFFVLRGKPCMSRVGHQCA